MVPAVWPGVRYTSMPGTTPSTSPSTSSTRPCQLSCTTASTSSATKAPFAALLCGSAPAAYSSSRRCTMNFAFGKREVPPVWSQCMCESVT